MPDSTFLQSQLLTITTQENALPNPHRRMKREERQKKIALMKKHYLQMLIRLLIVFKCYPYKMKCEMKRNYRSLPLIAIYFMTLSL